MLFGKYNKLIIFERKDNFVKDSLVMMGFGKERIGFKYLTEAIHLIMKKPKLIHGLTSKVFPIIAKKYNVTPNSIRRDICWSIQKAYNVTELPDTQQLIGDTKFYECKKIILRNEECFIYNGQPSMRQMIVWLFYYFIS